MSTSTVNTITVQTSDNKQLCITHHGQWLLINEILDNFKSDQSMLPFIHISCKTIQRMNFFTSADVGGANDIKLQNLLATLSDDARQALLMASNFVVYPKLTKLLS